jgi:O-antigen ligase
MSISAARHSTVDTTAPFAVGVACVVGAVAAAAAGGWLAAGTPSVVLAGAALLFAVHISVLRLPAAGLIWISTILAVGSATFLERSGSTGFSEIARVAAVAVTVRLLWPGGARFPAGLCARFGRVLLVLVVAYLFFAAGMHDQQTTFLLYCAGAIMTLFYAEVLDRRVNGEDLRTGVVVALTTVIVGSTAFGLVSPSHGLLGDRLRGLVSNPNLLGFYCALVVALLLTYRGRSVWRGCAWLVVGGALLWSGSRSGLLAAVLVTVLNLGLRPGRWRLVWIVIAAGLLVAAVGFPEWITGSDLLILRSNNSRTASYEYAMEVLRERPLYGIGYQAETTPVASTPLRALAQAGILGGVTIGLIYLAILYYSARAGGPTLVFGLVMIVHSVFEGWLLSPVGPMMMCFIAVWFALAKSGAAGGP